jgi:hypothetical protein
VIGKNLIISLTLIAIFLLIYVCIGEETIKITDHKERMELNDTKTLIIKWQRLVSDGQTCSRCGSTEEELEKAIPTLKQSLIPLGIEVVLEKDELSVAEFKKNPLQSNQIWLDDKPLEDWIGGNVSQSPCGEVCGPSECRTVGVGGEVYEVIPADLVIKAGLLAASELVGTETNGPCCKGEAQKAPTTPCLVAVPNSTKMNQSCGGLIPRLSQ